MKRKDILECLSYGIASGSSYSENIRAFCLKLHYYSPRAYEFVREFFKNHLPHVSTIKSWYRNCDLDATSGISFKSIDLLEEAASKMANNNQQLVCSLSFDEMAIRKSNQFVGTVTYGNFEDVANNAIVFMINGVNSHIRVPVAYYFITSIDAKKRENLLLQISGEILKRGVDISNVTFDGLSSNATMCELLGASLDPLDLHPYFTHPSYNHKVHIILDPSHCEKLARNNFAKSQIFYDGENNEIKWDYLLKLVEFSKDTDFGLSHKINKRHTNFRGRIMHVRTAVETLSKSVADSLHFLMSQNVEGFAHAGATIEFIRIFNDLFDVMNSQRIMHEHPNPLKSAINSRNKTEVFAFLEKAKQYLLSQKVLRNNKLVPVVETNIKTGFRGFLINIESVCAMYVHYVVGKKFMNMLPTYRLSQDHLEMFFHRIRARNGCNDNPTVLQFQASYKRIQMMSDLEINSKANISKISSSNIDPVPSTHKKRSDTTMTESIESIDEEYEIINLENIQKNDYLLDKCNNSAIALVANQIEQRLLNCGQIYCELCYRVLIENEKLDSRDCIGDKISCKSSFDICKATDIAIKRYIGIKKKHFVNKIKQTVVQNINFDTIFSRYFSPDHDISHKSYLIEFIIKEYIHIKCQYISKQKTLDIHKKFFRQKNRKEIHFSGI